MSERFSYFAYGLHIRADFALWPWGNGGTTATAGDSVAVELAGVEQPVEQAEFRPGLDEAQLAWPSVGLFSVRGGQRILVRPAPGATPEELALVVAGPALALLLEQRGCTVLHGSCVEIAGRATAFLGVSGSGKSTLAATLCERGHRLISDGMTVIHFADGVAWALPGPPHLKLWPDAIQSLKGAGLDNLRVVQQQEKRWYNAGRGLAPAPSPLHQVFLLEGGVGVGSKKLTPAAGLMGLVNNYFLADYANAVSREFILRRCASAAAAVTVSTLRRGAELVDMPAVLAHIAMG